MLRAFGQSLHAKRVANDLATLQHPVDLSISLWKHLIQECSNVYIIVRRGTVLLEKRILNALHYVVYGRNSVTLQRLPLANACRLMTSEILENVRHSFQSRLHFCQEVNMDHVEHLL
ncbi:hypothetical protein J6590_079438 [Homalodisca vitripennis]|nr:hypothetical protein J6590_079438 [Homalodisca vitripennis]